MKFKATFILITLSCLTYANDPNPASPLNTAANASYLSPLEKEIVYEINLFRSNPAQYAEKYIAPLAKNYQKNILQYPGDKPIKTVEGVKALHECVRELKKATPKPILVSTKPPWWASSAIWCPTKLTLPATSMARNVR